MTSSVQPADLGFFSTLASAGSLSAAARELGITTPAVSKHLAVLEAAGLVATVRRGREKLHYLNAGPINAIADRWISQYDRERVRVLVPRRGDEAVAQLHRVASFSRAEWHCRFTATGNEAICVGCVIR